MFCTRLCLAGTLLAALGGGSAWGQQHLCGARCVHYVLELSGRIEELTEIIKELNGSSGDGYTSFVELSNALKKRGFSTSAYLLGALDVPHSSHPIIVRVAANHFVVIEKSDEWPANLWDGLSGAERVAPWQLWARSADSMLVCVPPGEQSDLRVDSSLRHVTFAVGGMMVLSGSAILAGTLPKRWILNVVPNGVGSDCQRLRSAKDAT